VQICDPFPVPLLEKQIRINHSPRKETTMQRRHVVVAAAILNLLTCLAAFGQPFRPLPVRPARPVIVAPPGNGDVVIYEQKNFTGRSETLTSGDHRLTDWKPASIKVPAGLIAYLYESADSVGGYGISVDLMEDHRDLSEFGLNGKMSFISVVPSTRQGFFWARNSMHNGQFVAGHWERNRAGGNLVNTVAAISPPLPPHAPTGPTVTHSQVILYEDVNFGGRSKELGIGQYRLDDFNDIASSIKIPEGLGVFIYENFDDEGGFGGWIDLVADLADLGRACLNDKVSYIKVFSTVNNGFVWMPSSMQNNTFVAGHWERKRVNPAPPGPIICGQEIIRPNSQPHSEESDVGYGPLWISLGDYTPIWMLDSLVNFDANDVKVVDSNANIDWICPQHRSVGEQSALPWPKKSYRALEGIVKSSGVAYMDFPTSHYTRDFDFKVVPDPAYHYLFGDHVTGPGLNGFFYLRADSQDDIEVEWESGLGQNNVLDGVENPATPFNRYGNSFGFFSAGHVAKDEIWNWPADGDHVHVEGLWIWERAHQPVHTEIHPAHFVAVQRKLPVSLILDANNNPIIRNQPDDKYIATRVDVFASADGNPMFNTKGLNPGFNQIVEMKRKDYSFVIKHPFSKVIRTRDVMHSAVLQCKFIKQKGDNFPAGADPIVDVISDNEVRVTIPWQSKNVANTAVLARTFLVYWADVTAVSASTTKVLETEKPKLYKVDLIKVNLIQKKDQENDKDRYGDFRIYCNVGNTWIFLNEFTDGTDGINILSTGLGNSENTSSFNIRKSFNVYLPVDRLLSNYAHSFYDHLQIKAQGYEADAIDIMMGHIIYEYSRDKDVVSKFFGEHLRYMDSHGGADDEIGNIDTLHDYNYSNGIGTGLRTIHAWESHPNETSKNVFDLVVRITEIPYSATTDITRLP
jgi:hypothetical protein